MTSSFTPTARSGSPIPATASCATTKATKLPFELPANVYRLDPATLQATVVIGDMAKPNGLCFSPDEKKLYVVDTGVPQAPGDPRTDSRLRRCRRRAPGKRPHSLQICPRVRPTAFAATSTATSGPPPAGSGESYNGVHIFAPDGTLIGKIHLPEICANLCFGGAKRNRLFMAASQSLYSVYVNTEGAQLF